MNGIGQRIVFISFVALVHLVASFDFAAARDLFNRPWSEMDPLVTERRSCSFNNPNGITEFAKSACQSVIENSSACQRVAPERRRTCGEDTGAAAWLGKAADRYWGCLQGAGLSAFDIAQTLNDVVIFYGKYLFDGGKTAGDFGKSGGREIDSVSNYVASELQRAYDETPADASSSARRLMALSKVGENTAGELWRNLDAFVNDSLDEINCLNHEEQNKVLCRLTLDLLIPPAGAVAVLKYGKAAAVRSAEVRTALKSAKERIHPESPNPSALTAHPLCEGCPAIRMSQVSREHVAQHIGKAPHSDFIESKMGKAGALTDELKLEVAQHSAALARNHVETTIFPSNVSPDGLIEAIQNQHKWDDIVSKQPDRRIARSNIEISGNRYEVDVIFCVETSCGDAAGRKFQRGDVISVLPRCGSGVFKLRRAPEITGFIEGKHGWKRAQPIPAPCP